jgi:tRNA threonylcarbamoyl adenosine modification protein (Sua5/YciO/YrdC/YwlC family)
MSEVHDCTDPATRSDGIAAAAAAVRAGEVVVFPTDTVYGIGCDAFDGDAVSAVLAAKGRGRDMPPPVLIPTARTAMGLAMEIPDYANTLMERFWPGPLTIVLKAHTSLSWDLGETNGTVALRVPDNEVALELLGEIGPMAVTSANTTGLPAARTAGEAKDMLGESVSVYLDGGPAAEGEASTILDCTGDAPVTLRLGALTQEDIDAALAPAPAAEAGDEDAADEAAEEFSAREPAPDPEIDDVPLDRAEAPGEVPALEPSVGDDSTTQ